MPSNKPASKTLVRSFLKALDAFSGSLHLTSKRLEADILGVRAQTVRDWRTGKRMPTPEIIARVSNDLAAIERFLAVYPPSL